MVIRDSTGEANFYRGRSRDRGRDRNILQAGAGVIENIGDRCGGRGEGRGQGQGFELFRLLNKKTVLKLSNTYLTASYSFNLWPDN